MKTSVLIAVTHPAAAIADALASVAAQIHRDWEIVVVETGNSIAAEMAMREYAGEHGSVRYERMDDADGAAAVRNRLLELARGEAIAFLDPQDTWLSRHLATAVQHLEAGADVVISNARRHDPAGEAAPDELTLPPQLASTPGRILFTRDVVPSVSCAVIRLKTAIAAGRFDTRFRSGEAREFLLRCAVDGARFALTQKPSCVCGRPPMAAAKRALLQAEQAVQFYEKHRDLSAMPAALRRRLLAGSLVAQGRLLRSIDPARAARCFWRAWSLQPVHVQTLGQFALTEWRTPTPAEPHDVA